jgi:Flp pilus assembly pilin Flp
MESIKRFLSDESGTAESTSTVVMVAGVAVLLAGALSVYYGAFTTFFNDVGGKVETWGTKVPATPF